MPSAGLLFYQRIVCYDKNEQTTLSTLHNKVMRYKAVLIQKSRCHIVGQAQHYHDAST